MSAPDPLWPAPTSYPARVLAVLDGEDLDSTEDELESQTARWDDVFWAKFARTRRSYMDFIRWWIARRWVVPRDVRRR